MVKFTKDSLVDSELYGERLRLGEHIFINKDKMILETEFFRMKTVSALQLANRLMRVNSGRQYTDVTHAESLMEYLRDIEHCPASSFRSSNVRGFTVDQKQVLIPLKARGFAPEFLDAFLAYKQYFTLYTKTSRLLGILNETDKISSEGKPLHKLGFKVNEQVNQRFNYNSYDLITIPKVLNPCISSEKDYIIAWGDFPQSDLNFAYNLLIKDKNTSEIMEKYEDKYEGIARLMAQQQGIEFDKDLFIKERKIYKENIISTLYGQTSSIIGESDIFIKKFKRFLKTCERYNEFEKRLEDAYELGQAITVKSYFGHEERRLVQNSRNKSSIINQCLNAPMQSGTSAIMILTVNAILDKFYSLGYTEEDIRVYYCRHDEPLFYMKKEVMKDSWVFMEFNKIIVDNWSPITLDFFFGDKYKVMSDNYMHVYRNSCELNKSSITEIQLSHGEIDYCPAPKILKYYLGTFKTLNGYMVACVYNKDKNNCSSFRLDTTDIDVITETIKTMVCGIAESAKLAGYGGILLKTDNIEFIEFAGGLFVKATKGVEPQVSQAIILAENCVSKVDKDSVDPVSTATILNNNPWVKDVNKVGFKDGF